MADSVDGSTGDGDKDREPPPSSADAQPQAPWIPTMPNSPEAVAALAQRGVRDMVEVVSSLMGGATNNRPSPFGARPEGADTTDGAPDADEPPMAQAFRTIDAGADALKKFVEYFYSQPTANSATPEILRSECRPGDTVEFEWWLNNQAVEALHDLELGSTPLVTPAGRTLHGNTAIEPAQIDVLHERSSRAVAISIAVRADAEPGVYRGLVQAAGLDAGWKNVEITVRSS